MPTFAMFKCTTRKISQNKNRKGNPGTVSKMTHFSHTFS